MDPSISTWHLCQQKRGDKRVDAALLEDISEWREALAKNIALQNPELDTMDLNYSVQAIIDRIMFLRICEDRGIEQYMALRICLTAREYILDYVSCSAGR